MFTTGALLAAFGAAYLCARRRPEYRPHAFALLALLCLTAYHEPATAWLRPQPVPYAGAAAWVQRGEVAVATWWPWASALLVLVVAAQKNEWLGSSDPSHCPPAGPAKAVLPLCVPSGSAFPVFAATASAEFAGGWPRRRCLSTLCPSLTQAVGLASCLGALALAVAYPHVRGEPLLRLEALSRALAVGVALATPLVRRSALRGPVLAAVLLAAEQAVQLAVWAGEGVVERWPQVQVVSGAWYALFAGVLVVEALSDDLESDSTTHST